MALNKQFKKCVDYYLKNINSPEYEAFSKKKHEEQVLNYNEYVETEAPHLKEKTDFFENAKIAKISFGDVLSNDGVIKLTKKLYSLPKQYFKVNNRYKKPTLFKNYDYVHLQYTSSSTGVFSRVKFLKDKFISSIDICWSQINNYFAYFTYDIHFKKCLDDTLLREFVIKNIKKITKNDYTNWYYVSDEMIYNYNWLQEAELMFFRLICQHYITSLMYSEQGNKHSLSNLLYLTREPPININNFCFSLCGESFYNKKENYIICKDIGDDDNYFLLAGNKRIPNVGITSFIERYGNEFFYTIFGRREMRIFELEFSKFSTGRKRITFNKNLRKLMNEVQSTSESVRPRQSEFYEKAIENWDFYFGEEKEDFEKFYSFRTNQIKEIYDKNFNYLKVLTELNYSKSNHVISIIAAVVSVIATIISVISICA